MKKRKTKLTERAVKVDATCPYCGHVTDCASNLTGPHRKPHGGDLSICIRCGAIAQYLDHKLVVLTAVERAGLPPHIKEQLNGIRAAWRRAFLTQPDTINLP